MKINDVSIGQCVGFVYNGDKYIGVVKEINVIDGKHISTVETKDTIIEVNIKYLLGMV